jgi:hypothetical protein
MKKILLFGFLLFQFLGFAQSKVAVIIDAVTGETIPYANIKMGTSSNNVSNSEGKFNVSDALENQSLTLEISYIGYETQILTVKELEQQNFIIKLVQGIYELNNMDVSDKKEHVASIIAKVKNNLKENYINPAPSSLFKATAKGARTDNSIIPCM